MLCVLSFEYVCGGKLNYEEKCWNIWVLWPVRHSSRLRQDGSTDRNSGARMPKARLLQLV